MRYPFIFKKFVYSPVSPDHSSLPTKPMAWFLCFLMLATLGHSAQAQEDGSGDQGNNGFAFFSSNCFNNAADIFSGLQNKYEEISNDVIEHEIQTAKALFENVQQSTREILEVRNAFEQSELEIKDQINALTSQRREAQRNLKRVYSTMMNTCEEQGDQRTQTLRADNRIAVGNFSQLAGSDTIAVREGRRAEFECKVKRSNVRAAQEAQQEYNDVMANLDDEERRLNRRLNSLRETAIRSQGVIRVQQEQNRLFYSAQNDRARAVAAQARKTAGRRARQVGLWEMGTCMSGSDQNCDAECRQQIFRNGFKEGAATQ